MSDANKYINVYIENALGLVHEYINILLKTKTEAKLMEEVLKDKDLEIARLSEEVTGLRGNSVNVNEALEKARVWEDQYNSMKQRVAHMDTMASGFNEIKQRLVEKNTEVDRIATELQQLRQDVAEKNNIIQELEKQLKPFLKDVKVTATKKAVTPPKKEINTVDKAKEVPAPEPVKIINKLSQLKVQKEEETDDF
jgi:DNA repair exonuclease SbcCD ATPase subunit